MVFKLIRVFLTCFLKLRKSIAQVYLRMRLAIRLEGVFAKRMIAKTQSIRSIKNFQIC